MNIKCLYERYLASHERRDFDFSAEKEELFIYNYRKYFPNDVRMPLLDIGPGFGEMLVAWKRLGYQNICAVDISEEVVDYCRKIHGFEVYLAEDIKEFLKSRRNSFALINMCDVLEHIPKADVLDVLSSVKTSLQPGGRIIIQTPNMGGIFPSTHRYWDFTHEFGYMENNLRQVLKVVGFKNIEIHGFEGNMGKTFRAKMTKGLRNIILYPAVRLIRDIDYEMQSILHPYFYATATNDL